MIFRGDFSRAVESEDLYTRLHPMISAWFRRRYGEFTKAQTLAIPNILDRKSVLLTSPTGSGKTLAGFLGVIDFLLREPTDPHGIQAIYVSPLRALAYDIRKNLELPLSEMGLTSRIRVVLRTGDTPASERQRMQRQPPHILLTTPETIAVLLAQPGQRDALQRCRFVLIDELHSLAENQRGPHLLISLERLERLVDVTGRRLCRIGLSATVSPLKRMAEFLVGRGRPCVIAEAPVERRPIVEVFSPLRRNPYPPSGYGSRHVRAELAKLIHSKRTVLVFCNTRRTTEAMGMALKAELPDLAGQIEIHYSSLDRSVRLEVEDRLKNGELRAVVCSTSLEMGIDIGAIDLVVMISAPKGVSRTIQRIGRSGHSIHKSSHGILVATNINDLLECAVTAQLAVARRLDEVRIMRKPLDVLAQHIVGMAMAEPGIAGREVFETVRRALPYLDLTKAEFDCVLRYLEGGGRSLERQYRGEFGKIVRQRGRLSVPSRKVERDYLMNVGTILSEAKVRVLLGRKVLGTLDEGFAKSLKPGDIFSLGGRVVRLIELGMQDARVEAADHRTPNLPVWNANKMPLASGLAIEVSRVRGLAKAILSKGDPKTAGDLLTEWFVEKLELSLVNAAALVRHFQLQARISEIPSPGLTLIERYRPEAGEMIGPGSESGAAPITFYFVHSLIGRSANDALSRLLAWRIQGRIGGNVMVTIDDYGIVFRLRREDEIDLETWRLSFRRAGAEADLARALRDSHLVRWQFRGVAQTGLMVPRQNFEGERAARQLRFSSDILFRVLSQHESDHPMLQEAFRQATHVFLDTERAWQYLDEVAKARWRWRLVDTAVVSPFAFPAFASGIREGMMFEEPESAIERLFHQFYGREVIDD